MVVRQTAQGADPSLLFQVVLETFPDGARRTLSIEGPIRLITLDRPGMPRVHGMSGFDHRGHLIAHRFGGPSSAQSGNIVPMHGRINMSGCDWYAMEEAIARFLGDRTGHMSVKVQYGRDRLRPDEFQVEVRYPNGMHSWWKTFNYNPALRPSQ